MQRKSFSNMACPIARSLERVGEWWSILIIHDALHGFTRFDQFQKSLNIAPNMLTRRLTALVDGGLLERRRHSQRPPRYEYILTDIGHDFRRSSWQCSPGATGTSPRRVQAYCASTKRGRGWQIPYWSIGAAEDRSTGVTLRLLPALPPASAHVAVTQ
jgi:DNA-binding HxlR family transcriptional regulator